MAEVSVSMANAGDRTEEKVRVSMVPMGTLGSPWQPFMDNQQDWYLWWINCLTGNCWQEEKLHFGGSESIKRARQCPDVAAVAMIKRERREER